MGKYSSLFRNLGYLLLGNFGSKVLVFLLVPLYTSVLSTQEYGTFDLLSISVMLLIPVLSLNISESGLRFSLDKEYDKNQVFTISMKYSGIAIFLFLLFILVVYYFDLSDTIKDLAVPFFMLYSANMMYVFLSNFIRGIGLVTELAVASIINTTSLILFNILLLKFFDFKLNGYLYANILGFLIPCMYMIYVSYKKKGIVLVLKINKDIEKEMVTYSRPLILNGIGWWINSASDRYVVTLISGVVANGLYSVGYKIPSMLNVVSSIFNQAWVISASETIDEKDSIDFFSKIYSHYNFVLVMTCSVLIAMTKFFAKLLYLNDFYHAWKFVPFLLISTVFGGLSGFAGGIFSAQKNSNIYSFSTMVGAIVNIVFNFVFVYCMGPLGAAFSTMVSYFVIWFIRMKDINRKMKLSVNYKRDGALYVLLLLQSIVLIAMNEISYSWIVQLFFVIGSMSLLLNEFKSILVMLQSKLKG